MISKSFNLSATGAAIDMHQEKASRSSKKVRLAGSRIGSNTDVNLDVNVWLPRAAEVYNISADIRDYVIAPVPVNISELPNTNGDGFELSEWLRFNPDQGQLAYQTFKGKPTFIEHDNQDYTKAAGVILDSHLTKLTGFKGNHAKLYLLLAYDRTRNPEQCANILNGTLNTYSKGTTYKAYQCSICGRVVTPKNKNFCEHTDFRRLAYIEPRTGRLCYRRCQYLTGFECSSVADPAFACAAGYKQHLMYR